jgi:hypothetical protein
MDPKTPEYMSVSDRSGEIGKRYRQLETQFHQKVHRERTVQLANAILSCAAVGVEILIWILIQYALRFEIAWNRIAGQFKIFIILFFILLFGIYQFMMISKWNKAASRTKHLSQANFEMIDRMQQIRLIVAILLILCIIFFIIFFRTPPPPYPISQLPRIIRLWRTMIFLRRASLLIIIGYTSIELIQLIKWQKRIVSVKKWELTLLNEMPELTHISDNE